MLGYGVRSDRGFDFGQAALEKTFRAMQLVRGILERIVIQYSVEVLELMGQAVELWGWRIVLDRRQGRRLRDSRKRIHGTENIVGFMGKCAIAPSATFIVACKARRNLEGDTASVRVCCHGGRSYRKDGRWKEVPGQFNPDGKRLL